MPATFTHIFDGLVPPRRDPSGRPQAGEYAPYAAADISTVHGEDIVATLEAQVEEVLAVFAGVAEAEVTDLRYAPGKWTVKQVLGHMVDDERIFAYRALCIARGEVLPLPGFEQDDYERHARHEERSLRSLLREYIVVRQATLFMFWPLRSDEWLRRGNVSGYEATVRGLAFHIAGHERRHLGALSSKYLGHGVRAGGT